VACNFEEFGYPHHTTGDGVFSDSSQGCRWPRNLPSAKNKVCRWQSGAIGKTIVADGRAIGDKSPSATVQFAGGPTIGD